MIFLISERFFSGNEFLRFSRMTDLLYLMIYCKKNLNRSENTYKSGNGNRDIILNRPLNKKNMTAILSN
jgi:hypothetical protein